MLEPARISPVRTQADARAAGRSAVAAGQPLDAPEEAVVVDMADDDQSLSSSTLLGSTDDTTARRSGEGCVLVDVQNESRDSGTGTADAARISLGLKEVSLLAQAPSWLRDIIDEGRDPMEHARWCPLSAVELAAMVEEADGPCEYCGLENRKLLRQKSALLLKRLTSTMSGVVRSAKAQEERDRLLGYADELPGPGAELVSVATHVVFSKQESDLFIKELEYSKVLE